MSKPEPRPVELTTRDGTTLRGRLHLPDAPAGARHPAVVMTHGFSATTRMGLDEYASVICDGGVAVLVYDHRHLGESDGEPRQLINPWRQTRDQIDALGWLASQPEIDGERLGVWGSSYSGGQAIVLGAVDARVKAIVANVPFVGGFSGEGTDEERYAELRDALLDDTGAGPADASEEPMGPLAVVNESEDDTGAFLPQPESREWFLDVGRRPGAGWENRVLLQRAFGSVPAFDPAVAIPFLHAAALFVVASNDVVANTEAQLRHYDRAPEPKQLVVIEGHHFTPYAGDAFARAVEATREWLAQHL